jgi:hypothetical protein
MKTYRILFLITYLLALGGLIQAQEVKPAPDLKQKTKTFQNNRRFSVDYDKFKDSTHVSVGPFNIGSDSEYVFSNARLGMQADFFFSGQVLNDFVQDIYLVFHSGGRKLRFSDHRDLFAIVDGQRMELGQGERSSDVLRGGSVSETLIFKVPTDTFNKIANAKAVEMKVGPTELKLKDEHLIAFRDLLSLMKEE